MRWQDGYPCDTGSTDGQDSARLAGLMTVFNHPDSDKFNLTQYCSEYDYLRHPVEGNIYEISRDQVVVLFAGLSDKYQMFLYPDYAPKNKDLISPSVRGHFRRCSGGKAKWYQDLWLVVDILWSAKVAPLDEPNQLISMLIVHPNKNYIKTWCKLNDLWEQSIINYWCGWRGEKELSDLMIKTIKETITSVETK